MAKKFSELPDGTAPQDADRLAAVQSGSSVKWTIAQIKTMVDGLIGYAMGLLGTASAYDVGEAAGELPDNTTVDAKLEGKQDKILHNLSATRAPLPTDDVTQGYSELSRWLRVDVEPREAWMLLSAAEGAADWELLTLTIDELGTAALANIGSTPGELPTNAGVQALLAPINAELTAIDLLIGDTAAALDVINGEVI